MIGRGMRGENVGGTKTFDLYYVKDGILKNKLDCEPLKPLFFIR